MKRNVKRGLIARSKLVRALNSGQRTIRELCMKINLNYSKALYHITLLEKYRIVARGKKKPYKWRLTGYGQQFLI